MSNTTNKHNTNNNNTNNHNNSYDNTNNNSYDNNNIFKTKPTNYLNENLNYKVNDMLNRHTEFKDLNLNNHKKLYEVYERNERYERNNRNERNDIEEINYNDTINNTIVHNSNYKEKDNDPLCREKLNIINNIDIIPNPSDDIHILVNKNIKLRNYLIETTSDLIKLKKEYTEMEERNRSEKEKILNDLNRITENYFVYSESHRNLKIIKEELEKITNEFELCQVNLDHYKELIK